MNYKLTVFVALAFVSLTLQAQNWTEWRGPNGNGTADKGNYPVNFTADDVLWKAEMPGKGGSTPIVWKDRIILTSGVGEEAEGEDGVLCYNWDGKLLWQTKLGKQLPGKHKKGTGSNPSAATDGERLFVLFKSSTAAALDFDGKVLWKTNLTDTYGEISYFWDLGSSPILVDNKVVFTVMHEGDSYLLALDKVTGKVAWKQSRNYECKTESGQSYTTPVVVEEGGRTTLVVWGADHLTGHDAETGKLIWSYSGFNPTDRPYYRTIASAVVSDGVAVVPFGRGSFLAGMKCSGAIDMTEDDFMWENKGMGADVGTPVISDGKIYVVGHIGTVWCVDLQTGKELWKSEELEGNGTFFSSPTLAGDKLYAVSDEGAFFVCEATPTGFKVLNKTRFEDDFVATPVLVRDRLLLRGIKNLYCIEN